MVRKRKKFYDVGIIGKSALGMTYAGATMSVGGSVLSGVGSQTSAKGAAAISKAAGYMPVMGTVAGGGAILGAVGSLQKLASSKRKKRRK